MQRRGGKVAMTIDESIKTLPSIPVKPLTKGQLGALQLGMEALKLVRELRLHHEVLPDYLLPGETFEE